MRRRFLSSTESNWREINLADGKSEEARKSRAPFLVLVRVLVRVASVFYFVAFFGLAAFGKGATVATGATETVTARIEKARELVIKGERLSAVKIFKDLAQEVSSNGSKNSREVMQAWREVAEVFLADKSQNQASLAESFWMTRPRDAADILIPILKTEESNLSVARLGARAALRSLDCAKAETFITQAELVLPSGADVKLLRLQLQDCVNGTSMAGGPLKIPLTLTGNGPVDAEWAEFEPALRLLAIKDAFRRKDLKAAKVALSFWEAQASLAATENPEFWFWKWRISPEASRDRSAGREYLRICGKITTRRRKSLSLHPELCVHTETVESDLKTGEKSGL
jgi:hypothetical protein